MYEEKSLFFTSVQFKVGLKHIPMMINDELDVVERPINAVHLPIHHTLQILFEMPGLLDMVCEYVKSLKNDKNMTSNFVQGALWKRMCNSDNDRDTYPVFYFFDEFETGNGMGSHAEKQKFGGGYFSLTCFPPHLVSKLTNPFVSTIFLCEDRITCGDKKVFEKDIFELNKLSREGLTININDKRKRVYLNVG